VDLNTLPKFVLLLCAFLLAACCDQAPKVDPVLLEAHDQLSRPAWRN
jgi:outer membrane biogenesis lipoprotein LolB